MTWEVHGVFSCILNVVQGSHNNDLFHTNVSYSINVERNIFQLSNQLTFAISYRQNIASIIKFIVIQYVCMSLCMCVY